VKAFEADFPNEDAYFQLRNRPNRATTETDPYEQRVNSSPLMNLCYAAALALVGWYLMVPPNG
jgi:hypothetical protein